MAKGYIEGLFSLEGKTLLFTGGSGVLGSALALGAARAGAEVILLGRSAEKLEAAEKRITQAAGQVRWAVCDVLDKESLKAAYRELGGEKLRLDALVNAAGGAVPEASTSSEFYDPAVEDEKDIFKLDSEAFARTGELNFIGSFLPIQVFGPRLLDRPGGSIVNISSMGAVWPLTKSPAYSAGKAAVQNFTQWLSVYFGKAGVRVNAIAPGFFLTEQNRFLLTDPKTGAPSPRGEKIKQATPMARFGQPQELITTLLYLLSDASSFVTGAVLPVDGGFSAYGGV